MVRVSLAVFMVIVECMVSPSFTTSMWVSEGCSPVHCRSATVLPPLRLTLVILQFFCASPCLMAAWSASVAGRHTSAVRSGMFSVFDWMVVFARHFTPCTLSSAIAADAASAPATAAKARSFLLAFIAAPSDR